MVLLLRYLGVSPPKWRAKCNDDARRALLMSVNSLSIRNLRPSIPCSQQFGHAPCSNARPYSRYPRFVEGDRATGPASHSHLSAGGGYCRSNQRAAAVGRPFKRAVLESQAARRRVAGCRDDSRGRLRRQRHVHAVPCRSRRHAERHAPLAGEESTLSGSRRRAAKAVTVLVRPTSTTMRRGTFGSSPRSRPVRPIRPA